MLLLQRYVLKELAAPTVISLLFFTLVMLLRQLFKLAEFLLNASVSAGTMVELLVIIMMTLLALTIPMGALLGILVGIGRLTNENEILAMRVSGVSLWRVFIPLFALAAIVSALVAWGNLNYFPKMLGRIADQKRRISFELLTNLRPGQFYSDLAPKGAEFALRFEEILPPQPGDSPYSLRMRQVAIRSSGILDAAQTGGASNDDVLIFASSGLIEGDIDSGVLHLRLEDGTIHPRKVGGEQEDVRLSFAAMSQMIRPEADEEEGLRDPRLLTHSELQEFISNPPTHVPVLRAGNRRMNKEWQHHHRCRTELHRRIQMPFSILAFALMAVPLAIELRPQAKSASFLLAIMLILLYYAGISWATSVGSGGGNWVGLAMLTPNVLISGIGLVLFWRSQRA